MSAVLAAPASAADALLANKRVLFMSERFTPTSIRGSLSGEQPSAMMALRGETEGVQLAVKNDTASTLLLDARVASTDPDLDLEMATERITAEYLRVGFVSVPKGSTGTNKPAGSYADPLPPIRPGAASGLLSIAKGQWGGVAFVFHIRTDAEPGLYTMNLELFSDAGGPETVYARYPVTLDVRTAYSKSGSAQTLMQPGTKGAMKTILGVEGDAYWLAHTAMRNGPSAGYPAHPDRMGQLQGLMAFYGEHNITPLQFPLANPSAVGSYTGCGYDSPPSGGDVPNVSFATQLSRYLQIGSKLQPGASAFPVRVIPDNTFGCVAESLSDDFDPLYDPRKTPEVKQDDFLKSTAKGFWGTVYGKWTSNAWLASSGNNYTFNPYDEPSDTTAEMRTTMNTQVPRANSLLRSAMKGKAKVVLAGWPRDNRKAKVCKKVQGKKSCVTAQRDDYSNRKMWDGRSSDEVQVWMPPFSRLYGRVNNPVLLKHGWNRNTEYKSRLASIRKLPGGRETWGYNFFTATNLMPQLTIDAPLTDARLQYWLLARYGHTGLFVSNSMIGWGGSNQNHSGSNLRRKGNPFDGALYFKHNTFGYAAGWGTFIYPPYRPQLNLDDEEDRNTSDSRPVTSLRMEGMRDGAEDANLAAMYRARFGEGNVQARMRALFPGRYVNLPKTLGNAVFPYYNNTNIAQKMEIQRRLMIRALSKQ